MYVMKKMLQKYTENIEYFDHIYRCVKSVRIRNYCGWYTVRMRENADQNNSEYGHFSRSI